MLPSTRQSNHSLRLCFPVVISVWFLWLGLLGPADALAALANGWEVALTMVFGSFVAGASSVGGGAVAFPVLTKWLEVEPQSAKLFSLAIQSVGMTSASILIWRMGLPVHWKAVRFSSLGGMAGISISLIYLAPALPTNDTRVFFTALQAAFAIALLLKLSQRTGGTALSELTGEPKSPSEEQLRIKSRDTLVLVVAGFCGGLASGVVGCGIDLVVFSVLVLRFGVCEKIATPTSVIIMAMNSVVGIIVYTVTSGPIPDGVFQMWLSAVPVVVLGAPIGAYCCAQVHRRTVARFLVFLILVEVGSTLLLIPIRGQTLLVALGSLGFFGGVFYALYRTAASTLPRSLGQAEA